MPGQNVHTLKERMRRAFQHYRDTCPDGPLIDPARGVVSQRRFHAEIKDRTKGARGSSYSGVLHYLRGQVARPRENILRAMADALGVRTEYLVTGEPPVGRTDPRIKIMEENAAEADVGHERLTLGVEKIIGRLFRSPTLRSHFFAVLNRMVARRFSGDEQPSEREILGCARELHRAVVGPWDKYSDRFQTLEDDLDWFNYANAALHAHLLAMPRSRLLPLV